MTTGERELPTDAECQEIVDRVWCYAEGEHAEVTKEDRALIRAGAAWQAAIAAQPEPLNVTLTAKDGRTIDVFPRAAQPERAREPLLRPPVTPPAPDAREWVNRLGHQYGARQAADLRGDSQASKAADFWLGQIAGEHWHEILQALRAAPVALPDGDTR